MKSVATDDHSTTRADANEQEDWAVSVGEVEDDGGSAWRPRNDLRNPRAGKMCRTAKASDDDDEESDPDDPEQITKANPQTEPVDELNNASVLFSGNKHLIEPPLDLEELIRTYEDSNALRSSVDAYATNIDSFGHQIVPAIDFDSDDIKERVEDILRMERLHDDDLDLDDALNVEVSAEQVEVRLKSLKRQVRLERGVVNRFISTCCPDPGDSFVELRKRTRQDLEITGHAGWEVVRDGAGRVTRLVKVPSHHLRLTRHLDAADIEGKQRITEVSGRKATRNMRFRMYAQYRNRSPSSITFYKSFGDPRPISRDGTLYKTDAEMRAAGGTPANEMIYFRVYSTRSAYGLPRWYGCYLSVIGSTLSEEVNYAYFDNKGVPPMAVLISGGGQMGDKKITALERRIGQKIKGRDKFHKVLVLEAPVAKKAGSKPPKLEIQTLTEAQQEDALFQQYDERNIDKVGGSFRLPRLLRGDSRDFNRATAQSALQFAEDQVFQPERDSFDDMINSTLLAALGVWAVRYRSRTLSVRDPERLVEMIQKMVTSGVIVPAEGRELAEDVFNCEFKAIEEPWLRVPVSLALAGIQTGQTTPTGHPISTPETVPENKSEKTTSDADEG